MRNYAVMKILFLCFAFSLFSQCATLVCLLLEAHLMLVFAQHTREMG